MTYLNKVPVGISNTIKWIIGDENLRNFARRYGLEQGSRIRIVLFNKDQLIAEVGDNHRLGISMDLASHIAV